MSKLRLATRIFRPFLESKETVDYMHEQAKKEANRLNKDGKRSKVPCPDGVMNPGVWFGFIAGFTCAMHYILRHDIVSKKDGPVV